MLLRPITYIIYNSVLLLVDGRQSSSIIIYSREKTQRRRRQRRRQIRANRSIKSPQRNLSGHQRIEPMRLLPQLHETHRKLYFI